jgi:hypothetical protein
MRLSESMRSAAVLSGVLLLAWGSANAQSLPHTEVQNLSDKKVLIPEDTRGHISLFIVGFSRKSKDPTSAWAKRVMAELAGEPSRVIYQVAVLQDVPRILRGMVISSIRGGIPNNQRDHFLIATRDEPQWKESCGFKDVDDAYVLLADKTGSVAWHGHGAVNDAALADLQQTVKRLE